MGLFSRRVVPVAGMDESALGPQTSKIAVKILGDTTGCCP